MSAAAGSPKPVSPTPTRARVIGIDATRTDSGGVGGRRCAKAREPLAQSAGFAFLRSSESGTRAADVAAEARRGCLEVGVVLVDGKAFLRPGSDSAVEVDDVFEAERLERRCGERGARA